MNRRQIIVQRSRALRASETEAERKLWSMLRARRLGGLKFRRQLPIGRYIVDFACPEKLLVVECDGSQHAESERDATRDAWLKAEGYKVLRFWNHDVLQNPLGVSDTILATAALPF